MEGICPARCGRRQFIANTVIKGGSTCHARNPCLPERWSLWSSGLRSPQPAAMPRPAHPLAKARQRPRSIRTRACCSSPPATRADHAARAIPARRLAGPAGRAILATPALPVPDRVARATPARPVLRSARTAKFHASRPQAAPAGRALRVIPAGRALRVILAGRAIHALPPAHPAIHAGRATPVPRRTPATPAHRATRAGHAVLAIRATPVRPARRSS